MSKPNEVREHPIPFSGPMVRAILDGRKAHTRGVMNPQPPTPEEFKGSCFGLSRAVADGIAMYSQNDYDRLPKHPTDWELTGSVGVAKDAGLPLRWRCPYGGLGDRLWVKEAYRVHPQDGALRPNVPIDYKADQTGEGCGWDGVRFRSSRYMPRWASRILLEVTEVRAERLQEISQADVIAEGAEPGYFRRWQGVIRDGLTPPANVIDFAALWDSIYGRRPDCSWGENPWVWVIGFRRSA